MEIIIFLLIIFVIIIITKEIDYKIKKEYYLKQKQIEYMLRRQELKKVKDDLKSNEIKETNNNLNTENKKAILKSKYNYQYQYYKKDYILTKTELTFYKQLLILTNQMNLTLLTQIPIYSIIKTKNTIYKSINFNKIRGKSIDFVIATKNLQPIVCIELDDYTHQKPERIERDIFVNDLFKDLDIQLLRIPVSKNYNFIEIEYYIRKNLNFI